MRNNTIAALGAIALGAAPTTGCSDDEQSPTEPTEEADPPKPINPSDNPIEISITEGLQKARKEAVGCTDQMQINQINAMAALELKVSAIPGNGLQTAPTTTVFCVPPVTFNGNVPFGMVLGDKSLGVPPVFFEPNNLGCNDATAFHTLALMAADGQYIAYNGPEDSTLPSAIREEASKFLAACKMTQSGTLTENGQRFEGTKEGDTYKGTVTYPSGAVVEATFRKNVNTGEFYPHGDFTVTWPNGESLKGTDDGNGETEETAQYTTKEGRVVELEGNTAVTDLCWTADLDPDDFITDVYRLYHETMELVHTDQHDGPAGVERRKITEAEYATYTGYGIFTKFPEDSKYKAYEGEWNEGYFIGPGTLVTKEGQTIQATFKEGDPDSDVRFKPNRGSAFLELTELPHSDSWMRWTNKDKGEWDKYTWDDTEKKMVVAHMIPGTNP